MTRLFRNVPNSRQHTPPAFAASRSQAETPAPHSGPLCAAGAMPTKEPGGRRFRRGLCQCQEVAPLPHAATPGRYSACWQREQGGTPGGHGGPAWSWAGAKARGRFRGCFEFSRLSQKQGRGRYTRPWGLFGERDSFPRWRECQNSQVPETFRPPFMPNAWASAAQGIGTSAGEVFLPGGRVTEIYYSPMN